MNKKRINKKEILKILDDFGIGATSELGLVVYKNIRFTEMHMSVRNRKWWDKRNYVMEYVL